MKYLAPLDNVLSTQIIRWELGVVNIQRYHAPTVLAHQTPQTGDLAIFPEFLYHCLHYYDKIYLNYKFYDILFNCSFTSY